MQRLARIAAVMVTLMVTAKATGMGMATVMEVIQVHRRAMASVCLGLTRRLSGMNDRRGLQAMPDKYCKGR